MCQNQKPACEGNCNKCSEAPLVLEQEVIFVRPCSYKEFVERLMKPGSKIPTKHSYMELHHAVKLAVGELGELSHAIRNDDKPNILEELGDLGFSGQMFANICGFEPRAREWEVATDNVQDSLLRALEALGQIADELKQETIYAKRPYTVEVVRTATHKFTEQIEAIGNFYGFDYDTVLDHNFKKLGKRYGSVYSDAAAAARADKAE